MHFDGNNEGLAKYLEWQMANYYDHWSQETRTVLKGGIIRFRGEEFSNSKLAEFRGKPVRVYYDFVEAKPLFVVEVEGIDGLFLAPEVEWLSL